LKKLFQTAVLNQHLRQPARKQLRSSGTRKSAYRAVVSDINLAGKLDGWEVARIARESDPAMPVIYMTGTQGEEWASKGVPNSVLLAKPFAPAQLVTAIANLLNTASSPAPPAE
jgi:DNA-binding response OmpR family regulator